MSEDNVMGRLLAAEWRIKGVSEVSNDEFTNPEDTDFNILPVGRFRGYNYTPSGWRCELFGADSSIELRPREGQVPNAFWRWMQYLCFGNKWIKEEKK